MRVSLLAILALTACSFGDSSFATQEERIALADEVVTAPHATGEHFLDANRATNGVRGQGPENGSVDVFSLGHTAENNTLVLKWSSGRVTNGPGVDFKVFENAFAYEGGVFMDQAVVDLSIDGKNWVRFPHRYLAADQTMYTPDPSLWIGFAGCQPFRYHEDEDGSPFDVDAGGDAFDLDDLGDATEVARSIRADGFSYIRITTAATVENPSTGAPFVHDAFANGTDIDGVYGRYVR